MLASSQTQARVVYRGYSLEVRREVTGWRVVVSPRTVDLPILSRGTLIAAEQEGALQEAKCSIDRVLA